MIIPDPEALAQDFWAATGLHDIFPRKIEQAAPLKLPLVPVLLSRLTVPTIEHWLRQRGIATPLPDDSRDLRGCLVALRGHGFIFVCNADSAEEQRLTIAHEVAHFLMDYLLPRQHVMRALGADVTAVLDGLRPPTPAERAAAILSYVRLGAHVHILPRPGSSGEEDGVVAHAEDRADRLALELVAPRACVGDVLSRLIEPTAATPADVRRGLATHFGLPLYAFDEVIQHLFRRPPPFFITDIITELRRQR
jgi:hypothetical protein